MQKKKLSMDNLCKLYQKFCHKQVQIGQYVQGNYEWSQWYMPVPHHLRTLSIIQEELNSDAGSEQAIKCVKINKDTASNKRTGQIMAREH